MVIRFATFMSVLPHPRTYWYGYVLATGPHHRDTQQLSGDPQSGDNPALRATSNAVGTYPTGNRSMGLLPM